MICSVTGGKIIIIGAGFAGTSCAWWLARLGMRNVVVLEREEMPGLHASGLNAGMARLFEEDEVVAPLAREGIEFIHNPPEGFADKPLIECDGSLLLNCCAVMPSCGYADKQQNSKTAKQQNKIAILSREDAIQKISLLSDAKFNSALWTPTDGIVDIHAYLWAFINGAKADGVKFLFGKNINDINIKPHDIIVNAAGAWAQEVANMFGAEDLKIKSYRRHLYCTPPMPEVDPKWPFVWDMKNEYYFRPESGGLLLGACDEEEVAPCTPPTNPKIRELLAEKLMKYCPALANIQIAREWCGLRTFAPDRMPVIRWDRKVKNFFWLAALGGRGVTCAAAVGRMAAHAVIASIVKQSR